MPGIGPTVIANANGQVRVLVVHCWAVLDFLIEHEFMNRDQLEAALIYLQDASPEPADMGVVNIVMAFKQAAG